MNTKPTTEESFADIFNKYGMDNFDQMINEKIRGEDDDFVIQKNNKKTEPKAFHAQLDLHAQTRNEAITNTEDFIKHCQINNLKKITIITGKGTGILQETIKQLLDNLKQKKIIEKFKKMPQNQGGDGAFMVILK
jgi:DNA-nicking Smr family endonuclease